MAKVKARKIKMSFKDKMKKLLKFSIKWGFILGVWLGVVLFIVIAYFSRDLPDLDDILDVEDKNINIVVNYSNNREMRRYTNMKNIVENYAEFPLYLVDGLVATEDRRFFKHNGLDYLGIFRAFIVNIKSGTVRQGGSTITQQLSKMILEDSRKTAKRKIQEVLLSFQLEKKYTKEQIVTIYLNKSYFGGGKYGVADASKFYFGKRVSELNLEESALLIGLLKAPSKYSPQNNSELSKKRTKQIIVNMHNAKLLSDLDYLAYISNYESSVDIASINTEDRLWQEYYFSDWIRNQLPDYTDNRNISIRTTLNYGIQKKLEIILKDFANENSKKLNNSQIAVLVMAKDGAVLGMVGGLNYNRSEFNRAVYALRQAGSAFKLFVFLAGIRDKNYDPETTFRDEPVAIGNWFPENYGEKYYGNITMKFAFAKSLNSVAIKMAEYSGLQNVAKMAKKMGIISPIDGHDPTIALGTTEVSLLELTSAYAVIANNGVAVMPYSVNEIKNNITNSIIYSRKSTGLGQILDEKELKYMKEMLFEVVVNGTGKNAAIPSLIDKTNNSGGFFTRKEYYIGGKTGTSQNYTDAWFIGYADDKIIGVWIGGDSNNGIGKIAGGTLPAKLWKEVVVNGLNI